MTLRVKKMRAWLITWEWMNDASEVADRVVAILPPRWSPQKVKEIAEWLYAGHTSSCAEFAEYAKHPKAKPYSAEFDSINGVPHADQIHCGHHPFMYARLVRDLEITEDEQGFERLTWINPDSYRLAANGSGPEIAREGRRDSCRRTRQGRLSSEPTYDRMVGARKPEFRYLD